METTLKTKSIPQIDSIEELARFWDSHDVTDFEDALEEVVEPVFERFDTSVVTIDLPAKELAAIKQIAKERRVEPITLVREWILEKLYYTELMRRAVKEFHAQ
ncbi:CopG family antitoxin [Candidatus Amarolinea aalborgensis]|jgi:hypothetical protein|uniref:CopG family antitoxin n=1 Tax=Candidatus Amarolinea aalborgensis TaxID=2249329 RepID=UPI003BF95DC4